MAGLGHFKKFCFLIKVLFIFAKFSPENPPLHQAAKRYGQVNENKNQRRYAKAIGLTTQCDKKII